MKVFNTPVANAKTHSILPMEIKYIMYGYFHDIVPSIAREKPRFIFLALDQTRKYARECRLFTPVITNFVM